MRIVYTHCIILHVGFGESSGLPMPAQTISAADTVMQYALKKLAFSEDQIIIYAWSIGGFPGTWLAANYADIKVWLSYLILLAHLFNCFTTSSNL